jgi:hypothetical protein
VSADYVAEAVAWLILGLLAGALIWLLPQRGRQ